MRVPKRFPDYPKKPHASGQARMRWLGTDRYLGVFDSPESHAEYDRLRAEWRASRGAEPPPSRCRTVNDLIDCWYEWAERTQLDDDGHVRRDVADVERSYAPLAAVYGDRHLSDFGARELLALQESMATGAWMSKELREQYRKAKRRIGWSRGYVNRTTSRIKRLFSWGEVRGLVPKGKAAELVPVRGIAPGEHGAIDHPEVPPVAEDVLAATLPHLRYVVRAIVEVLLWTGARPSEILNLRPCDIHRGGRVELARGYSVELPPGIWWAQPERHKGKRKKLRRVLLFGPRSQINILPFLDRPPTAYLFSPAEEMARHRATLRQARKTKVQPSQQTRAKARPRKQPGNKYDHRSLLHAVKAACRKAGVPPFSVYSLRHLAATRLAQEVGVEIASTVLGHTSLKMTAVYSLPALQRAADALQEHG